MTYLSLLFTHHDSTNIHKILGFVCLTHYVIRIYWLIMHGKMFFDKESIYTWATPFLHITLSLSSFIFHVPKYRFDRKAIIWKELQLHNIAFTSRSVVTMLHFLVFSHDGKQPLANMFDIYSSMDKYSSIVLYYSTRFMIIVLHHIIADQITQHYIVEDKTTTRDIPWGQSISYLAKKCIKTYYAICQCLALNALIMSNCDESGKGFMDNAFLIMFPIQLSAFLMTLVRKNIITNDMWHIFYAMSLMTPFIPAIYRGKGNEEYSVKVILSVLYIVLRLIFHMDKYFLMANTLVWYLYYEKIRIQ